MVHILRFWGGRSFTITCLFVLLPIFHFVTCILTRFWHFKMYGNVSQPSFSHFSLEDETRSSRWCQTHLSLTLYKWKTETIARNCAADKDFSKLIGSKLSLLNWIETRTVAEFCVLNEWICDDPLLAEVWRLLGKYERRLWETLWKPCTQQSILQIIEFTKVSCRGWLHDSVLCEKRRFQSISWRFLKVRTPPSSVLFSYAARRADMPYGSVYH
jgi:hypothetical protein